MKSAKPTFFWGGKGRHEDRNRAPRRKAVAENILFFFFKQGATKKAVAEELPFFVSKQGATKIFGVTFQHRPVSKRTLFFLTKAPQKNPLLTFLSCHCYFSQWPLSIEQLFPSGNDDEKRSWRIGETGHSVDDFRRHPSLSQ